MGSNSTTACTPGIHHLLLLAGCRALFECHGCNIVQIGAGTGAPGMVAALMGAAVTLTDRQRMEHLLNRNAALINQAIMCGCGVQDGEQTAPAFGYARFAALEWGANIRRLSQQCPTPEAVWGVPVLPADLIIASDVCVAPLPL